MYILLYCGITTIIVYTELSTESALISYISNSYESACTGQSESIYLTAQSIVNTSRVYYKNNLNPQVMAALYVCLKFSCD